MFKIYFHVPCETKFHTFSAKGSSVIFAHNSSCETSELIQKLWIFVGKHIHLCYNCFPQVTLRSHGLLSTWCCAVPQSPIPDFCTATLPGSANLFYIKHRHTITFPSIHDVEYPSEYFVSLILYIFCITCISQKTHKYFLNKAEKEMQACLTLQQNVSAAFLNPF